MREKMRRPNRLNVRQKGSYLLEALIAMLLFAFGILGRMGLLASSVRASNDARFRSEAADIANAMVGRMWTMSATQMNVQFGSGGAELDNWQQKTAGLLPASTVAVDLTQPGLSSQSSTVIVTITWQLRGSTEEHNYIMAAQIGKNP
jgi:type IV pilus assembly protein PilV